MRLYPAGLIRSCSCPRDEALASSGMGRSRLIEHHALRPDGVADERVEVLLAKDDIDGTTERLPKLPVDCATREAEGARGFDDEVDVRALRGVAARVAAEERHLVEAMGRGRPRYGTFDVVKSKRGTSLFPSIPAARGSVSSEAPLAPRPRDGCITFTKKNGLPF